jgi:hypothetical protein
MKRAKPRVPANLARSSTISAPKEYFLVPLDTAMGKCGQGNCNEGNENFRCARLGMMDHCSGRPFEGGAGYFVSTRRMRTSG